MPEAWLKIGEIAALLGVSTRTLRHYQKVGLIAEPERTDGQYRLYTPEHLEKLRQIRDLQAVGLKLHEIGFVLDSPDPEQVLRQVLQLKVEEFERQIRLLAEQKDQAEKLLEQERPMQQLLEQKIPAALQRHLDGLAHRVSPEALAREKQLMAKMLSYPTLTRPEDLESDLRVLQEHPEHLEQLIAWSERMEATEDPDELDRIAHEMAHSPMVRQGFTEGSIEIHRQNEFLTRSLLPQDSKEAWILERIKHHLRKDIP